MNLNTRLIKRKIALIQDDLEKLSDLSKYSFEEITSDYVKQAALERILERIIMRAVDINQHITSNFVLKDASPPKNFKETFDYLAKLGVFPEEFAKSISKSIGLRNKLVHEYEKIDEELVYSSVNDCLRDYHKYCDYVLEFILRESFEN